MDRLECGHPAFRLFVRRARLVLGASAGSASAALPEQPIRVIFPFSQGPASDSVSRMIAQGTSESVKQAVMVDLRPGADGNLGSDIAAKVQHAAIGQRVAQDRSRRQPAPGAYKTGDTRNRACSAQPGTQGQDRAVGHDVVTARRNNARKWWRRTLKEVVATDLEKWARVSRPRTSRRPTDPPTANAAAAGWPGARQFPGSDPVGAWRHMRGRYKPIRLAMMLRWISLVPAPMGPTRESRKYI